MKIGYVLANFPALSETFIRREILALCERGHSVTVYAHYRHHNPLVADPSHPRLAIRSVRFLGEREPRGLKAAIQADTIEHLRSSLDVLAHQAMYASARSLRIPFSITAYSGHDLFTRRQASLYAELTSDSLCEGVVVEDPFMRDWIVDQLRVQPDRVLVIANSLDLDQYQASTPRAVRENLVVLAIARFVEKKGLTYLIQAFQQLTRHKSNVVLWLIGNGPEEGHLRRLATGNPAIKFLGPMSEEQTRSAYQQADVFCLPCVQTGTGDADGIPTTILEAMAFELPVVTSELLSAPYYVHHEVEGLLAKPGDVANLTIALERLCGDAALRVKLGRAGRARVSELCELQRNIQRLESMMVEGRVRRWRANLQALVNHRQTYTSETQQRYTVFREKAITFFEPRAGKLLDVGCGHGAIRPHLPPTVTYLGCDPLPLPSRPSFSLAVAHGEHLPYPVASVEMVLLYAALTYVVDQEAVLREIRRVLRPGGYLYVHECVDDYNPAHLNHYTPASLTGLIGQYFQVQATCPVGSQYLLIKATKPQALTSSVSRNAPLASVAIATYNRQKYLRACIDSILKQTYRPVEVCVCDDGSTDNTRHILAEYGTAIRVTHHERNQGIAAAKNSALKLTSPSARYVAVLDSDDMFHPRFIDRCVEFLEDNEEVGLVYTDDTLVDADGKVLAHRPAVAPWSLEEWLRTCNLRGDTWLARRELVMRTALHDESFRYDVDYDLFYQLLELTTFANLPEALVSVRRHAEQSTRNQHELAKYHAANLVKYGFSPEYAYLRARKHPEWRQAIAEGIKLGMSSRAHRPISEQLKSRG